MPAAPGRWHSYPLCHMVCCLAVSPHDFSAITGFLSATEKLGDTRALTTAPFESSLIRIEKGATGPSWLWQCVPFLVDLGSGMRGLGIALVAVSSQRGDALAHAGRARCLLFPAWWLLQAEGRQQPAFFDNGRVGQANQTRHALRREIRPSCTPPAAPILSPLHRRVNWGRDRW